MRALVSRGLLLPPLVCAALVLGPVGAATAAEAPSDAPDTRVARSLLSEAGLTPERLRALPADTEQGDALSSLLTSLTSLIGLTGADKDTIDAVVAAEQAQAVEQATAQLQEQLGDMTGTMTPNGTTIDPAPSVGTPADVPARDTSAALETSVDGLVSSLAALDVGGVAGAVPKVLSSVLGLLTGVSGGGLAQLPTSPTT
ncbi:hypothetical protein [Streptomyces apricus]|uniref:Secreted protein n=1 Tax=Streptomyces apricus TaxID=1828112 RepID=A0A5B0BKF0_9ACTN|nr:hypothetical protein [Streptomyces apricus]KAA0942197.1 hypothetical protein FGF04_03715 [Streptomyces apricus]